MGKSTLQCTHSYQSISITEVVFVCSYHFVVMAQFVFIMYGDGKKAPNTWVCRGGSNPRLSSDQMCRSPFPRPILSMVMFLPDTPHRLNRHMLKCGKNCYGSLPVRAVEKNVTNLHSML